MSRIRTFPPRAGLLPLMTGALAIAGCAPIPAPASAQPALPQPDHDAPGYVDLVDLARASDLVARVTIDDQITVPVERAPGLQPGQVRLYLETLTGALLAGASGVGESLVFLADMPADSRGRAPRIKGTSYLVFADYVPSRPGEIRLVAPNAMQPATPALEERVRQVLTQFAQGDAPPTITGVREVMSVPGNLAGESETQIFLATQEGTPVSLSIIRRPGMQPEWGVSWSEIVDQSAQAPARGTLDWYALACFLPRELPGAAFLQADAASRAQARADYRLILDGIGSCDRSF